MAFFDPNKVAVSPRIVRPITRPLQHQLDLFNFEPADGRGPTIESLLGSWGTGKSQGGALKFMKRVMQSPRTDAYGAEQDVRPRSVVMTVNTYTLENAVIPKLRMAVPGELIVKEWRRPITRWLMINGHEITFVSANSAFEGADLCHIWLDEVHSPEFADPNLWKNLMARLRDKHAPVLSMICTGLPAAGALRTRLDPSLMDAETRKNVFCRLCGTNDNPFIDRSYVRMRLSQVPFGQAKAVLDGAWGTDELTVFPSFDDRENIVPDTRADPNTPVYIGMDIGNHSSAVLGQDVRIPDHKIKGVRSSVGGQPNGLLVLNEVVGWNISTAELCDAIKQLPEAKQIIKRKSVIYVDPTIRREEVRAINQSFPDVLVKIRAKSDEFYSIEPGIRMMNAAMKDGNGTVRLWLCERLRGKKNGVLEAIVDAKRSQGTGHVIKNDRTDHARDALRYLVNGRLGDKGFAPTVTRA